MRRTVLSLDRIKQIVQMFRKARPTAGFWSILADKVAERDWKAKVETQLRRSFVKK